MQGEQTDKRQSVRHGRQRGVRIFIPAEELEAAGIDPHGEPPSYSVHGVKDRPSRGLVLVRVFPS